MNTSDKKCMTTAEVHEYFPSLTYRTTGKLRNIFSSYGSMHHLLLHPGIDHMTGVSQRQRNVFPPGSRVLKARTPSLPMSLPVNLQEFKTEPCLSSVKANLSESRAEFKELCRNVKSVGDRMVLHKASQFQDQLLQPVICPQVNNCYVGGVLKYQEFSLHEGEGILFYPQGKNMDMLASVKMIGEQSRPVVSNNHTTQKLEGGQIYGIDAVNVDNSVLCLTRSQKKFNLFTITYMKKHTKRFLKTLTRKYYTDPGVTSAALNPFGLKEFIFADGEGECTLHSIESNTMLQSFHGEHRFECGDPNWQCCYGMHPRQVVLTDRTGVALYDIRAKQDCKSTELFTLPHQLLNTRERVYVSMVDPNRRNYCYVASSNNLVLVDQRFPNHPVLHWSHLLLSPPTYIDIVPNINRSRLKSCDWRAGTDDYNSMDLVLLGCQDYPECHVFPLIPASNNLPPTWTDTSWRISKPSNTRESLTASTINLYTNLQELCTLIDSDFSELSGFCPVDPENGMVNERLGAPLVGVSGMRHKYSAGFTAFQMTSFGDVFLQTYTYASREKDTTFNTGPGSHDLKLDNVTSQSCCDWLCEAERTRVSNDAGVKLTDNVPQVFKAHSRFKRRRKKKSHIGCMFCQGCSPRVSTEGDLCGRCEHNVEHSQLLHDSIPRVRDKPLPSLDDMPSEESIETALCKQFADIRVSDELDDALTKILLKLWRFEDNIPKDLLLRTQEEFIVAHPELWTSEGKTKEEIAKGEENDEFIDDESEHEAVAEEQQLPVESFSLDNYLWSLATPTGAKTLPHTSKKDPIVINDTVSHAVEPDEMEEMEDPVTKRQRTDVNEANKQGFVLPVSEFHLPTVSPQRNSQVDQADTLLFSQESLFSSFTHDTEHFSQDSILFKSTEARMTSQTLSQKKKTHAKRKSLMGF